MKRLVPLLCLVALPAARQGSDEFTNLTVCPEDIGQRELVSAMRMLERIQAAESW